MLAFLNTVQQDFAVISGSLHLCFNSEFLIVPEFIRSCFKPYS